MIYELSKAALREVWQCSVALIGRFRLRSVEETSGQSQNARSWRGVDEREVGKVRVFITAFQDFPRTSITHAPNGYEAYVFW